MNKKIKKNPIKVVFVGNAGVGKSSLITTFIKDTHDSEQNYQISSDKYKKEIKVKHNNQTYDLLLEIWNSAGNEKFRNINTIFIKNAEILIFVYDTTNKKSYDDIKEFWLPSIKKDYDIDKMIKCICANKTDLYENEEVDLNKGKQLKNEIGAEILVETSIKDFESIENLFQQIGENYITKLNENQNVTNLGDKEYSQINVKNNYNLEISEAPKSNESCCKHCNIF